MSIPITNQTPSNEPMTIRPMLILGGALLINLLVLFVGTEIFSNMYPGLYRMNIFTDGYDRIAQNIVDGHGYKLTPDGNETMTREPGYIYFLVMLFYFWGKSIVAVKIANFILAVFAVFMMYRLGRLMGLSTMVVTIAAAFFLIHPGIIGLQSRGGSDILFICQVLCVLYALQKAIMTGKPGYFIFSGILLGVTVLTRSLVLPFPGVLLLFLIWTGRKQQKLASLLKGWVLLVVAMLVIMSPWVARNYRLSGKFVPVGSISGMAIFHNVYINKQSNSIDRFETLTLEAKRAQANALRNIDEDFAQATYFPIFKNPEDEIAFSNMLKTLAFEIIKEDPLFVFRHMGLNMWRFWFQGENALAVLINTILIVPILASALFGMYLCLSGLVDYRVGLMFCLIITIYAVHIPIGAHARHHLALMPFLMLFGAIGMERIGMTAGHLIRQRRPHHQPQGMTPVS